ncbi:hypothetical protein MHBO_003050 [Bonamia ostreae]|uniref:WW domain-containing protein n=1 Tax=Bonamia ostreae TaxID=126728 RepID=A0ABV2APB7_9EUKA
MNPTNPNFNQTSNLHPPNFPAPGNLQGAGGPQYFPQGAPPVFMQNQPPQMFQAPFHSPLPLPNGGPFHPNSSFPMQPSMIPFNPLAMPQMPFAAPSSNNFNHAPFFAPSNYGAANDVPQTDPAPSSVSQSVASYKKEENVDLSIAGSRAGSVDAPKETKKLDYTPRVSGKWIEYKTEDGALYYYDSFSKETQWEKPGEFSAEDDPVDEADKSPKVDKSDNVGEKEVAENKSAKALPKSENKGPKNDQNPIYSTFNLLSHEECVHMFNGLLEEQNIPHDAEWAGILSDIIKDTRYSAIKTLGERKKLFSEYCDKKRTAFKKKQREEMEKKVKDFKELLSQSEDLSYKTKFSNLEDIFANDARFRGLKNFEKRDIFTKFRDKLRKKQKKIDEENYKKNAPLLEKKLSKSKINSNSQWNDVCDYKN